MAVAKKVVTAGGMPVTLTENAGAPLIMLVRMAATGMGLWDRLWQYLTPHYTVASFDLPTPVIDEAASPVAMFHDYARKVVEVARGLGYERFHFFGWVGGARVAIRCLVDFPEHLHSCIIYGLNDRPADVRAARKNAEVVNMILDSGNLELYTYNWLLSGFSPEYAAQNFDEIKTLVDARMEADRGRMDTRNVQKWIRTLGRLPVTEEELSKVTVPTLLVAAKAEEVTQLHALIKSSQVAAVPGARQFLFLEDPAAFMAAAGPFLRAAARGIPAPAAEPKDDARSTLVKLSSAGRVQAIVSQPDEAIVFLHGWLMSPEMWTHSLSALAQKIRCVALWQPGHGRTAVPAAEMTMAQWAGWLLEALDSLGVKKAVLVGHSMGGMLSLATVLRHPERVKGLVLVDTQDTAWDKERVEQWLQTVSIVATSWGQEIARGVAGFLLGENFINSNPGWVEQWAAEVAGYDLAGQVHLARAIGGRQDVSSRLGEIEVPALVVHGAVDQAIAPEVGRAMAGRIPGARFVEIPGAAHCPPLETPALFTRSLVDFLESSRLPG